jgi:hypothetical protein
LAQEIRVDFAAVSRIARRVDLREIRLVDLSAKLLDEGGETLAANTKYQEFHEMKDQVLTVRSVYLFAVTAGEQPVAEVSATYRILYDVGGIEPVSESDISQFAFANGMHHSWPFLRQLVFDITAKIGLPPYTLPLFLVNPQVKQVPEVLADTPSERVADEPANETLGRT